jgi:hypothetical protein
MTAPGRRGSLAACLERAAPPDFRVELTEAISAAMVDLYGRFYRHDRTTATTYINDNVVVCIPEDILSLAESDRIADGEGAEVIDGRVAFLLVADEESIPR